MKGHRSARLRLRELPEARGERPRGGRAGRHRGGDPPRHRLRGDRAARRDEHARAGDRRQGRVHGQDPDAPDDCRLASRGLATRTLPRERSHPAPSSAARAGSVLVTRADRQAEMPTRVTGPTPPPPLPHHRRRPLPHQHGPPHHRRRPLPPQRCRRPTAAAPCTSTGRRPTTTAPCRRPPAAAPQPPVPPSGVSDEPVVSHTGVGAPNPGVVQRAPHGRVGSHPIPDEPGDHGVPGTRRRGSRPRPAAQHRRRDASGTTPPGPITARGKPDPPEARGWRSPRRARRR